MRIWTIGHSNHPWRTFLRLLQAHHIELLIDIRSRPQSARNPQFHKSAMASRLEVEEIGYRWRGKELGGFRREGLGEDSPNQALERRGFRNYADYMRTPSVREGVRELLSLADGLTTAYMCAERLYWQCHRRLLSDYLLVHGHDVYHIQDKESLLPHRLSDFAVVENGELTYPEAQQALAF